MNIGEALHSLRPGSEWVVRGTDIEWLDKVQAQPSQSEIDEEIVRLQAAHDAQAYARTRADCIPINRRPTRYALARRRHW